MAKLTENFIFSVQKVDTHIQQLDQYLKKFDEDLRRGIYLVSRSLSLCECSPVAESRLPLCRMNLL